MSSILDEYVKFWSVHSKKDDKPCYRGWAKSEDEAKALAEQLRQEDGDSEDAYWVIQMTKNELDTFRAQGEIPADA